MRNVTRSLRLLSVGATAMVLTCWAAPAQAHHGKDFLLTETDDMPLKGHVYGVVSADTNIDVDGSRSSEITPGVLFAVGDRVTVEPHFHVTQTADQGYHYDATALDVRYNVGYLPRSEVRLAFSAEVEQPKDGAQSKGGLVRIILVRTLPNALVAVNLAAGKEFTHDAPLPRAKKKGPQTSCLRPLLWLRVRVPGVQRPKCVSAYTP